MWIADCAKKAENCEHFVESYKLKHLKGAGAGQRHKTTEKRRNMLKEK